MVLCKKKTAFLDFKKKRYSETLRLLLFRISVTDTLGNTFLCQKKNPTFNFSVFSNLPLSLFDYFPPPPSPFIDFSTLALINFST